MKIRLQSISTAFIVTTLVLSQFLPIFTHNVQAATYQENLETRKEYSPALASDSEKNTYIVWQDSHSWSTHPILAQKTNIDGSPIWEKNIQLYQPNAEAVEFLSVDTDAQGNFFVAWVDSELGFHDKYLWVQKFNSDGEYVWSTPFKVMTASDGVNFDTVSVSEVRADNNGNLFFSWLRHDLKTKEIEPYYQVVNSTGEYSLWEDGKKLSHDFGMKLLDGYGIDLELNKKDSIAYVSWLDAKPEQNYKYKTINIQKINYNGVYMWSAPYHLSTNTDWETFAYPGIEIDSRENIFITYLAYKKNSSSQNQTTVFFKRINRRAQNLWEDRHTIGIDPQKIINKVGFAVDDHSKIFFLFNTNDSIILRAFEPTTSLSNTDKFQETFATILRKGVPTSDNIVKLGHTSYASIAKRNSSRIVVAWNQFDSRFQQVKENDYALSTTFNEHIYQQTFEHDLSKKRKPVFVDTNNTSNSEMAGTTPKPSREVPKTQPKPATKAPTPIDTDGDGINDTDEITTYKTDPKLADTDGDGYHDGDEIRNNYNPLGICRVKKYRTTGPIYTYGVRRLSDTTDETCREQYLKEQLQKQLTKVEYQHALTNWSHYLNAFIYGEYPLDAIKVAVQKNKSVIHNTLPWKEWSKSETYKNNVR